MAWGFRGVRDDLTELGLHILDIACFLHPLLDPTHTDSPPLTPTHCRFPSSTARRPSPPPPPQRSRRGLLPLLLQHWRDTPISQDSTIAQLREIDRATRRDRVVETYCSRSERTKDRERTI
ncbi:hypothetical protein E2562_006694 [Oryza meyeriana var. granulata]|uniref:Uncharacterized protein n=1 Tax=Oryza meyeriana var. granulata TaxID=110450 RepID=A0A6G1EID6_9ORYZ|nr:hypothetical protein E2562_006694 [Oryza meyeriana var. granulata]